MSVLNGMANLVNETPSAQGQDNEVELFNSQEDSLQKSRVRRFLVIAAACFVIVAILGMMYYKNHTKQSVEQANQEAQHAEKSSIEAFAYYDLGEILVNLEPTEKNPHFCKIHVILELAKHSDLSLVRAAGPKIRDALLVYLRTLGYSDLRSSVALYRLREEMALRISKIISPAQLVDVLFKDVLMQ